MVAIYLDVEGAFRRSTGVAPEDMVRLNFDAQMFRKISNQNLIETLYEGTQREAKIR